jgi:hypothetical protein
MESQIRQHRHRPQNQWLIEVAPRADGTLAIRAVKPFGFIGRSLAFHSLKHFPKFIGGHTGQRLDQYRILA